MDRRALSRARVAIVAVGIAACLVLAKMRGRDAPVDHEVHSAAKSQFLQAASVEFGDIEPSTIVEAVAELKNATDRQWTVLESWSSCACLSARVLTRTVAPGAELRVRLSLTTHGVIGPQDRSAFVRAEGLDQIVEFNVTGRVLGGVSVTPARIHVSLPRGVDAFEGTAVLRDPEQRLGRISPVNMVPTVQMRATRVSDSEHELTVTGELDSTLSEREFITWWTGDRQSSQSAQLPVSVLITRASYVQVSPRIVLAEHDAKTAKAVLSIYAFGKASAAGIQARVVPEGAGSIRPADGNAKWIAAVSLEPTATSGRHIEFLESGRVIERIPVVRTRAR